MFCCCFDSKNLCKDFDCKVENLDNGIKISLTSDDKKKVEGLQKILDGCKSLSGDKSCCC